MAIAKTKKVQQPEFEKLPEEFNKNGFSYKLEARESYKAIYSQSIGGLTIAYEVIHVRISPERECFGKIYPPAESYPSASEFGTYAWSFGDKAVAMRCYEGLKPIEKKPKTEKEKE
jgi:hypothetical protein